MSDKPALETVRLADGLHTQAVLPGVAPVSLSARLIEAERKRRAAKRGCAPCPDGGLFAPDRQEDLF